MAVHHRLHLDKPWYHEFHWHGLQLLAGNSFVLAGLAGLAALAVAALLPLVTGLPLVRGPSVRGPSVRRELGP